MLLFSEMVLLRVASSCSIPVISSWRLDNRRWPSLYCVSWSRMLSAVEWILFSSVAISSLSRRFRDCSSPTSCARAVMPAASNMDRISNILFIVYCPGFLLLSIFFRISSRGSIA